MRKQVFGRSLKRDTNERKALFAGLISSMVTNGSLKTTEQKAKAIRSELEKLVTKAKKSNGNSRGSFRTLLKPSEVDKLINQIAPTFKDRNGGYTRMIKTGRRFSDNASMVIMQWVDEIQAKAVEKQKAPSRKLKSKIVTKKSAVKKSTVRKTTKITKKAEKK